MLQNSHYIISSLLMFILVILFIMVSVAFFTLFERKMMALFHYRKGPNKIGIMGLMQPFSDAMKLLSKEFFLPFMSNFMIYMLSPMFMIIISIMMWMIYPFLTNMLNFKMNTLFFLCIMSMGVYSLMLMGWSSNSSFSMIGAIRSIAQSISYEVIFTITLLIMMCMINSLKLNNLLNYSKYLMLLILFYPIMMILLISMLAEINRTPFDLSEGESELVSGFNVEYGESKFTLIFLSEYATLLLMMYLITMIFFSLNYLNIMFYMLFFMNLFLITWIRMTFPRIRYDMLMFICWFFFLPLTLINYMMYLFFIKLPMELLFLN
uniref:NADH-ubiquinone oxidoreductase chain 1 n=1 Tax=Meteorus pulchricornis TaxID=51522 RepID=D8WHE8_9HYME|nr:NADH dehydrogenase subunit 1 [Meteorus pulchricornis]ACY09471.1 NADH dehydrogenase subunit 1 [Meteorus pulchricornis]QHS69751.1 NADH dehydrogenase subunit 1 [Meteorus pulchricornis]WCB99554.1 NADH dehydrogenase subunit 1 [Meteorus pulchricornis]